MQSHNTVLNSGFEYQNLLTIALSQTQNSLSSFASSSNYLTTLQQAFGGNFNTSVALDLVSSWQNDDFRIIPSIQIVNNNVLQGANGAFSLETDTIYISEEFIRENQQNIEAIAALLLEEIGHKIDSVLNTTDSQGDEGAIFAALILGYDLMAQELAQLQQEDDTGFIIVNGEAIAVEFQDFPGTTGNDTITGTNDDDVINGIQGNDSLSGAGGNDRIIAGVGNDTISGGTGNDTIVFDYSAGTDVITDFVQGQDKIDVSSLNLSDWTTLQLLISNDNQDNALITTYFNGGTSILKINGINFSQLQATDFIFNTDNINQTVNGDDFYSDQLFGGLGNDTIRGLRGNDVLFGERGDDRLEGGIGNDTFYGGTGKDVIVFDYSAGSDVVIDFVQGQDKIDVRSLNLSDWTTLQLLISNDNQDNALITTYFNGGTSILKINDINFSQLQAADFIFNTDNINQTIDGDDFYSDQLFGGLGNDTIRGLRGNDVLFGERGDDRLEGGLGNDTLYGGLDNDTAAYVGNRSQYSWTNNGGVFTITDSVANRDGIDTLYGIQNLRFSDQTVTIAPVEVELAINNVTLAEGNSGTNNAVFTVTRMGTATQSITVQYTTANGTATAGSDYTATTGTLTFATNETTKTIAVPIIGDTTVESNETFFVNLSNATNAIITDNQGLGTISNDDPQIPPATVTLSTNPSIVTEDGFSFIAYTFTRTGNLTNSLIVNFNVGGTATFNSDYTPIGAINYSATTGNVSFATGQNTAFVIIDPLSDTTVEPNETVNLTLTPGSGYSIGTASAVTSTITNDDAGTGNDSLTGASSNDSLNGLAGNDTLVGGEGNDTLTGKAGLDNFVFNLPSEGIDTITDFSVGDDTIVVSKVGFKSGLTVGTLATTQFIQGAAATTANHRFIYNNTNGQLLFDSDGNGVNAAISIATLSTGLAMTNQDILVIA
ncbi:Calx-beta domain-containing protein [Aphanothece hegewaldii]|nr:Calx-beta domain-containing protein [Aphanothece hegewaldii]